MKTSSLDILEKALPHDQAVAILQVMESEIGNRDERLATREQVHALELKMVETSKALETRLVLWMFGMFIALAGLLHAFPSRG